MRDPTEQGTSAVNSFQADINLPYEIANFEITVCIEKQVGWFEIAVDDIGRMESFQSAESLINKVLGVIVG